MTQKKQDELAAQQLEELQLQGDESSTSAERTSCGALPVQHSEDAEAQSKHVAASAGGAQQLIGNTSEHIQDQHDCEAQQMQQT